MCWIEFRFRKDSYTIFFDVQSVQGAYSAHFAQCTFCTIFQTFLFFKLESYNLVCKRKIGFGNHSYIVVFGN